MVTGHYLWSERDETGRFCDVMRLGSPNRRARELENARVMWTTRVNVAKVMPLSRAEKPSVVAEVVPNAQVCL